MSYSAFLNFCGCSHDGGNGDHSHALLTASGTLSQLTWLTASETKETHLKKSHVHAGETCKTSSRSSVEVDPLGKGAMGVTDQATEESGNSL